MCVTAMVVCKSVQIVKARLHTNAREGPKERLAGKAIAKEVH